MHFGKQQSLHDMNQQTLLATDQSSELSIVTGSVSDGCANNNLQYIMGSITPESSINCSLYQFYPHTLDSSNLIKR